MATNPTDTDAVIDEQSEYPERDSTQTSTGLEENVAGALSYLFGALTGIIFYLVEQDNEFVRFHAAQSIVLFGIVFAASVFLGVVGTVTSALFFSGGAATFLVGSLVSLVLMLAWLVVGLVTFGLWVFMMVRAYQGKTPRVPIAAGLADKLV